MLCEEEGAKMRADGHPPRQQWSMLETEGSSRAKTQLVLHLMECEECWLAALDFIAALDARLSSMRSSRASLWSREPALAALLERFRLEQDSREAALLAAAAVADVRRTSRKARREALVRDRAKHHESFVRSLLAEARRITPPLESEEWGTLALLAAQQIQESAMAAEFKADLLAECYAEIASARRRSAKWKSAQEALRQGEEHARQGGGSLFARGMLLAVEGLIEGDCGGLERAEHLLNSAADCFLAAGAASYAARSKIQVAYVLLDVAPERSIEVLDSAISTIPKEEGRLYMFAESIRVDALITTGRTQEASARFDSLTFLYDQFGDPFVQLRRRFTAARLLESLGKFQDADALFAEVIAADLEQRSNKSYFLDQVYMVGSFFRRGDLPRAAEACRQSLGALSVMELDEASEAQMRKLWTSLEAKLTGDRITLSALAAARQYVKTQWRVVGGDALLVKESAV